MSILGGNCTLSNSLVTLFVTLSLEFGTREARWEIKNAADPSGKTGSDSLGSKGPD
jgi:hypothetical protein